THVFILRPAPLRRPGEPGVMSLSAMQAEIKSARNMRIALAAMILTVSVTALACVAAHDKNTLSSVNQTPRSASGKETNSTLIARAVWDTIAEEAPTPVEPALTSFKRLFKASPIGLEMYSESVGAVSKHIGELAAVDSLLTRHGLSWRPSEAT